MQQKWFDVYRQNLCHHMSRPHTVIASYPGIPYPATWYAAQFDRIVEDWSADAIALMHVSRGVGPVTRCHLAYPAVQGENGTGP